MKTSNRSISDQEGKILAAYLLVFATAHNAKAVLLTNGCLRGFFKQGALQRKNIQRLAHAVIGIWAAYCDEPYPQRGGREMTLYLDKDAKEKKAEPITLNYLPPISEISEKIFPAYMPQS